MTMLLGSLASAVSDNDNILAEEINTVPRRSGRAKEEQKGVGLKNSHVL
jgi:hypothetical protein